MCPTLYSHPHGLLNVNSRINSSLTPAHFFVLSVVWVSALVDLPQNIALGGFTFSAMLTVGMSGLGWILYTTHPVIPKHGVVLFLFMLFWAITSFLWNAPDKQGVQNLSVLILFIACLMVGARESKLSDTLSNKVLRVFEIVTPVTMVLYLAISQLDNGRQIMFPRAFAAFSLIALCVYLAKARYNHRQSLWMALLTIGMIGYSLSRSALVVSIVLLLLSRLQLTVKGIIHFILFGAVAFLTLYLSIMNIPQLYARFFTGDMSLTVGGIPINAMGRTIIWEWVISSIKESPLAGHGVGSSERILKGYDIGITHPHNDYLRILHDYGAIGFMLWMFGFLKLLQGTWNNWRHSEGESGSSATALHLSAFLSLVAVALMMITDNPIVCSFVMAPVGLLVGSSIGRRKADFEGRRERIETCS